MKYTYDWQFDGIISTPNCADEYLELICDIAIDYDGYNDEKNLKELIDEMANYAREARRCISEGKIKTDFEESVKSRKLAEEDRSNKRKIIQDMAEIVKSVWPEAVNKTFDKFTDVNNIGIVDKE